MLVENSKERIFAIEIVSQSFTVQNWAEEQIMVSKSMKAK